MIEDHIHIADLLHKQSLGMELSPEERKDLDEWENSSPATKQLSEEIRNRRFSNQNYNAYLQAGNAPKSWKQVVDRTGWRSGKQVRRLRFLRCAAFLALLMGVGSIWFLLRQPEPLVLTSVDSIRPGQTQAILTLSDGRTVHLNESISDSIIPEKNGIIIQRQGRNLHYAPDTVNEQEMLNTIKVPRGGEYQLILADGTKVWLNSETRLTYPVAFHGQFRELHLDGEAYFEVTRKPEQPFLVHTSKFDIRVIGTSFNVRTYPDDIESATLIEGRVVVQQGKESFVLQPGQQARLISDKPEIRTLNTEEVTAWRNDIFYFKDRSLESIMNDLARWYDFDVFYQNSLVKDYHFTAWFHRSEPIQKVMTILEKTHKIKLKLNGKTLMVELNQPSLR